MEAKVEHRKVGTRTIMTLNGAPVPVTLIMREATTAHARVKATLAVVGDGGGHVALPFTAMGRKATAEFRLEQN